MTPRRPMIKQAEIKRAVAGVRDSGLDVERVEIDPVSGKVVVIARGAHGASGNPWDELHR